MLAFCFLIYDTIHAEDLWARFFEGVDQNHYQVYVHYKTQAPLRHFEHCKLAACVPTAHWHVSLVQAQNRLLEAALAHPCTTHCLFVSHACVPLKTFAQVQAALAPGLSYFNRCPDAQCFPRCDPVPLPREAIKKASQWCILARAHAELLVNTDEYLPWFDRPGIPPDEHAYITYLHWRGKAAELVETPNSAEGATTFNNWPDMDYRYVSTHGLKHYSWISPEELAHLRASPCLFGRKFLPECIPCLE
jgi:hypothetical protein